MGVVEGLRYARQRNLKKLPHWSLGSREGCSRRRGVVGMGVCVKGARGLGKRGRGVKGEWAMALGHGRPGKEERRME